MSQLIFNDWDLWFVMEGQVIWKLQNGDLIKASKDDFLLLPPLVRARCLFPKSTASARYCHFGFLPLPHPVFPSVRMDCGEDGRNLLIPLKFSKQDAPKVWRVYQEFLEVGRRLHVEKIAKIQPYDERPWQLERAVINLLSELAAFARRLNLQPHDGNLLDVGINKDPRVVKLCFDVQNKPSYPWKVSQMARSIGLSLEHLERLCRATLGQGLKNYILVTRLQQAMTLLRRSDQGDRGIIKQITSTCGFSSPQLFSHQFKKFYGMTPLKAMGLSQTLPATDLTFLPHSQQRPHHPPAQ